MSLSWACWLASSVSLSLRKWWELVRRRGTEWYSQLHHCWCLWHWHGTTVTGRVVPLWTVVAFYPWVSGSDINWLPVAKTYKAQTTFLQHWNQVNINIIFWYGYLKLKHKRSDVVKKNLLYLSCFFVWDTEGYIHICLQNECQTFKKKPLHEKDVHVYYWSHVFFC